MREIATIKVLGYTEREVDAYVNRESLILAMIGGGTGLILGIWLHRLIMNLAELDDVMFGRIISPLSYLFAFGLTVLFALLVNFVMRFRLRKVEMVESLKAVE
nr:ABC transporter permease [Faecalibaculum rodentium]